MKVSALVALAALAVSLHATPAVAQVDEALQDYTLVSWSTRDGLPSNFVTALAQDADGYLWVGTSAGLVRFDGLRFVMQEGVGRVRVAALLAGRDGALWVGHGQGPAISRIQRGRVRRYDGDAGLAGSTINGLVEDPRGVVWAANDVGLFRLNGDRWVAVGADEGLPGVTVQSLSLTQSGALVAGTPSGLYRRAADAAHFEKIDAFDNGGRGIVDITEDARGRLWVADDETGFRQLGRPGLPATAGDRARGNRVLFDRLGNLWVGTTAALLRVRPAGDAAGPPVARAEIFGGRSLFEDRDGNVWVGTVEGRFRLSVRRIAPVTEIGVVSGVETTPDGSVWAGTSEGLLRYPGAAGVPVQRARTPGSRVRALHADRGGTLWLTTEAGLVRIGSNRVASLISLPGIVPAEIDSVMPAADGVVWFSTRTRGLFLWRNGRTEAVPGWASARILLLNADRRGRVWFVTGAGNDRLFMLQPDGVMRSYGEADGLGPGPYRVVHEDSHGILWVSGSEGMSRFVNDRFVMLRHAQAPLRVAAVSEDDDGDLWLGTNDGIAVLRREEVMRAIESDAYPVRLGVYDVSDGLAGLSLMAGFGNRNVAKASDGRIWFVTGRGFNVVSPRALKGMAKPVTVGLENVTVDDEALDLSASAFTLGQGSERLQIDYAAVELGSPQKVRYRYLLEGFDAEWIDAGARRVAVYQHLPAREYTFRVVAANIENPWNEAAAAWSFSVSPPVYQTPWFAGLVAVALLAATGAFWQLRLRSNRRQFALLLAERVRLSRELHDTLLQSLVAVTLQFEAVAGRLEPSSPVRRQLIGLRKQMEEYIRETREAIWNLRAPAPRAHDLVAALREACERTLDGAQDGATRFRFSVEGIPRRSSAEVERHVLRIAQESVLNAVRHAHATQVEVQLSYDPEKVVLRISDDGRGFDVAAAHRERNGHLGLVTMEERAKEAGGEFTIESRIGGGTRVEVAIPAAGRLSGAA